MSGGFVDPATPAAGGSRVQEQEDAMPRADDEPEDTLRLVFLGACGLAGAQREAYLERACAGDAALRRRVETLLAAEEAAGDFLDAPLQTAPVRLDAGSQEQLASGLPERIGPFAIRRVIGIGGASLVYEAEQRSPQRLVALKVLRATLATPEARRRFLREGEVLGRLGHPNIAPVFEAGTHEDGGVQVPYLAMELVEGEPLTAFATARGLDERDRIELLLQACEAVEHAHQRGVIHRDLKPDNILVDAGGRVKVLDFGVARLIDREKASFHSGDGTLIGTPGYMSPEQLVGDPREVDTRSDVYALGTLLFELLAGTLPFGDETIAEAAARARGQDPPRLGQFDRSLRGDLETIAARALAPEKSRRYASVGEFASDLRRYLAGEAVLARRPTTRYQLAKLVRKHRALATGAAVFLAMLALLAAAASVLALQATRQRDAAVAARRESDAVSALLLDLFLGSPDVDQVSRIELLTRADRRLAESPPSDPRIEAKLREYIGHGYHKLTYVRRAEPHLKRAVEIRRELGAVDEDFVQSLVLLGMQRGVTGKPDEAAELFREALAHRRNLLGPDHIVTHPHHELRHFASIYTPEEPEVSHDREHRRRLAEMASVGGEPAPLPSGVRPLFSESFESETLGPAWALESEGVERWGRGPDPDRLHVVSIDPHDNHPRPRLRFLRALEAPIGDFRVQCRVAWDSAGTPLCMQDGGLMALGPARTTIAYASYTDGWNEASGGRSARIGNEDRRATYATTGHDTLPAQGEVLLTVERRGSEVRIWWNGEEILRGRSDLPLSEICLTTSFANHTDAHGRSVYGGVCFDDLRVWKLEED